MIYTKCEPDGLEAAILRGIKNSKLENVLFTNTTFDCKSITDAAGNVFIIQKNGKWESIKKIDDDSEYGEIDAAQCSICKHTEDSEYWAKTYYNFCPNCGADMRGEKE